MEGLQQFEWGHTFTFRVLVKKNDTLIFHHSISNNYFYDYSYTYALWWHFENSKMANWVYVAQKLTEIQQKWQKFKFWKITVFVKNHLFLKRKLSFFKICAFTFFVVSWLIFELLKPTLPFWNSQSVINKLMYSYNHKHDY